MYPKYTKLVFSLILTSVSFSGYAQMSSFKDEFKKELWKTIKPTESSPLSLPSPDKKSELFNKDKIIDNKYIRAYNKYKYKSSDVSEMFKDKYQVNPDMLIYRGDVPLNKLAPGSTTIVYMGGHFHFISNAGLNVVPAGINFGGGTRKTLSEKSRSIIENVYGLEIED